VARIKTALAVDSGWKWERIKDPGKRVERREAKGSGSEEDWESGGTVEKISAPTTRSGGKAKGVESVSAGTRSKAKGVESVSAGARDKGRAKGGTRGPSVVSVDADGKGPLDKGGETASSVAGVGDTVAGGSTEGGDSDVEGQPLRRRGPHSLEPHPRVEELSDGEGVDEDDWTEKSEHEFEENLTYYEDSLSVMKGTVSTPLGKDIPVWVTTDSGSMTMLMQAQYAKRLKLKVRKIPEGCTFHINSPGGGRDEIEEYVVLHLKVMCKQELQSEQGYDECTSVEVERTIKMKFGLCESLPVPVLWGGKQMRDAGLLDYHDQKTLSVKLDGERFITPSRSWLAATMEMGMEVTGKAVKVYKPFIPSKERLSNMVVGGRKTINMPAILYPGRDNVVRVGRHNARVDEGYNEVLVENLEEFSLAYGGWVVPIECITNGEAFIIVRNNADKPIRLTPGALTLSVKPTVAMPTVVAPREILNPSLPSKLQKLSGKVDTLPLVGGEEPQESLEQMEVPWALSMAVLKDLEKEDEEALGRCPRRFLTWNLNGLAVRMKKGDLDKAFLHRVLMERPDLISLQEVRLQREEGDPSKVKIGSKDEAAWEAFMAPLRNTYDAYLSLSSFKYGGQAVLVKKEVEKPVVSYNMGTAGGHYKSGRFIKLEFEALVVRSVYVPFNGAGKQTSYDRRRAWDAELKEELTDPGGASKARLLMGDLNVALRDSDMTANKSFWSRQGDQTVAVGDRGFGGTTENERSRMGELVEETGMVDTFTTPLDERKPRHTFQGQGKFLGHGAKFDYVMADNSLVLSGGVESSEILGGGFGGDYSREGFMGSDHAPLTCVLHPQWQKKRANLLAHYVTAVPREERRQLSTMFANTAAVRTLPKVSTCTTQPRKVVRDGMAEPRPEAFPPELWSYVEPAQRPLVKERFALYASRDYLGECLADIVTNLDIQPREEFHTPEWFVPWEGEPALQAKFLLAQAVANPQVYFHPNPAEVAMAKDLVAEVVTTSEKPFNCRSRKLSVTQQAFLQAKTNIMLRMKQLEEAKSEWCHGLVLVAYEKRIRAFMEAHGEAAMSKMFEKEHEAEVATFFRLCVDLRMLNARTVPDRFPLPRIDDLLESVPRMCGRYSISDIADAFFKCELKKEHRHKTAFRTHDRHLQFAVLPQGFINSPSVFCRLIARTFEGMSRDRFSAYIDDVLNHTDDFQQHLDTQQELYDRLGKAGLTLKISKTHLNYESVKFLGHILTKEGRLPDPEAVEAIREWSDPTTTKEVRSFLGSTLYYREYIHDYSDMAMPLYDLIKKGVVVSKEWKADIHGLACQRIKDALTSKPVLMQVDNTKPFRLKVDACRVGRGIGSILEQQNARGKWQPVSFYSCSLSKEERNYSATELECKALHDCILHYAVYLKYIPHFEVFSDHNALRYMVTAENSTTNGRLMRYLLDLQEYNFAIFYRKGTENCDADAVSRLKRSSDPPVYMTEDELSRENGVVSKSMLERARALDKRNTTLEKAARKLMAKLAKQSLSEMSLLNDHILAEGVENLESESGRSRFFENLKAQGLKCSRQQLDTTLEAMQEDQGAAVQAEPLPMITAMVCALGENRGMACAPVDEELEDCQDAKGECAVGLTIDEASDSESSDGDHESSDGEEGEEEEDYLDGGEHSLHTRSDYGAAVAYSGQLVPFMLALLVEGVERDDKDRVFVNTSESGPLRDPLDEASSLRRETIDRVRSLSKEVKVTTLSHMVLSPSEMVMAAVSSTYGLRKRKPVKYDEGVVTHQPNTSDSRVLPKTSPVNEKLLAGRKHGHGRMVVMESLIPGDTGFGLFAGKAIKEGEYFCSYEGPEVPIEHLLSGYGNKDYVIEAIKNHKTQEVVCMDSPDTNSCYGRYAQDPIDEDLVNAKIVWRKGRMVLRAMCKIVPGDEIYVHYGLRYWKDRLHYLDDASRARIEPRIQKMDGGKLGRPRSVQFRDEATIAKFQKQDTPSMVLEGVQEEGELTHPPAVDYQTRMDLYEDCEGVGEPEDEGEVLDQAVLDELSYENVHECEELAESLQFLNGRKFEDEGRMYEIMQVRYDPEFEKVIGFRRPMSGKTPHKEDGSAFCVYGREGLYELSELYLLRHPEDRSSAEWPANNIAWAEVQSEDPELQEIIQEIQDQGGGPLKRGRNKYALRETEDGRTRLLVRMVTDTRKGPLEQSMVPEKLVKPTLLMHHEGYGHMGTNRMLETIRLRYFWSGMDKDIMDHTGKCLNCKLRKSYQRKPKVPIMKYSDTSRPLDRVHVDLTGPLPTTKQGHRYIMVIKDYLTKFVWLIPLKTKTAMEVAQAFVGEFVCLAGIPGRLVSDRGNEFVNQLLTNISKVMGVARISTTPYNPRSDGFVENHNKTLKDQLFHYVDTLKQDDWDSYLPTVQLMYNTTVSLSTGYTPMLLMTGREARMPGLNHLASEERELRKDVVNNAYVLKMIETMRGYQDFALSQTEKNKGRFNVRVKQPLEFVEYEEGQQFMRVRRPISKFKSVDEKEAWKISAKLLERFEGPYRIIRRISPVLYEADIDGKVVTVHAVNMKPF
jgi:exodeoxyribonuclease III